MSDENVRTCFVISPIGEEGTEKRKNADDFLELLIEPALQPFHFEIVRADRIASPSMITTEMIQYVQSADLCVIDLTGQNPNVYYECGRRHETGRPFIQLIKKGDSLPFDLAGIRTISYDLSTPRAALEGIREIQSFVAATQSQGFSETASGDSLSSLADSIRRIERKINTLTGQSPSLLQDKQPRQKKAIDILTKHPITAFNEALDEGDLQLATQLLARIKQLLGISEAIKGAVILGQAGVSSAETELIEVISTPSELNPEDLVQALFGLREYYYNTNRPAEGAERLTQVLSDWNEKLQVPEKDRALLLNQIQMLYLYAKRHDDSIKALEKAIELAPEELVYRYNLIVVYQAMGDFAKAAPILDELLVTDYEPETVLQRAVEVFSEVGRAEDAERAKEKLLLLGEE